MIQCILQANPNSDTLYVLDTRPRVRPPYPSLDHRILLSPLPHLPLPRSMPWLTELPGKAMRVLDTIPT